MSLTILILTIAAQICGKSVIKKIWSFFLNLQILILCYYVNQNKYPANVKLIFDSMGDMLEMKAIPKK